MVSQCSLNAWLQGWLAEISANLREVIMYNTNLRLLYFTFIVNGADDL